MEIYRHHRHLQLIDEPDHSLLPLAVLKLELVVDLAYGTSRKKPSGLPRRTCIIALRMPCIDTAFLAGSSEASASTAIKQGCIAVIWLSIIFTITLYSG